MSMLNWQRTPSVREITLNRISVQIISARKEKWKMKGEPCPSFCWRSILIQVSITVTRCHVARRNISHGAVSTTTMLHLHFWRRQVKWVRYLISVSPCWGASGMSNCVQPVRIGIPQDPPKRALHSLREWHLGLFPKPDMHCQMKEWNDLQHFLFTKWLHITPF